MANLGLAKTIRSNKHLSRGVNIFKGQLTNLPVSELLDIPYAALEEVIARGGIIAQQIAFKKI